MNKKEIFLIIQYIIIIIVMTLLVKTMSNKIYDSRLLENNCLEEEKYYYRYEGGLISARKVRTTEGNSDGYDYECTKWEEEPSAGKSLVGQKLIHNKGKVGEGGE